MVETDEMIREVMRSEVKKAVPPLPPLPPPAMGGFPEVIINVFETCIARIPYVVFMNFIYIIRIYIVCFLFFTVERFYAFGERRFSTTFWGTNSPTPKSHLNSSILFHFPANLSELRNFTKKKPRLLKEERIPRTRVVRCVPSRRTRDASWMRRGSLSTHIVEIQRLCTLILPIVTSHGKTFPKR